MGSVNEWLNRYVFAGRPNTTDRDSANEVVVGSDGAMLTKLTGSNVEQTAGSTATGIKVVRVGGDDGTNVQSTRVDAQRNLLVGLRSSSGVAPDIGGRDTDAKIAGTPGLDTNGMAYLYNPTANLWERQRNNTSGTLLASAARTATASSASQTNYNARGVLIYINVSVAGTGSLTSTILGIDSISASETQLNTSGATAITTTGIYAYVVYPGASAAAGTGSGQVVARVAQPLPRAWKTQVAHSDGSSWTYSVGYDLVV